MNLTDTERSLLLTLHGNAYDVRDIRSRLAEVGLKWCPQCAEARPVGSFASNGTRALQMVCHLHQKTKRRSYARLGTTTECARTTRYRNAHPARVAAAKAGLYERRKAMGMTGRQAAYKEKIQ